MRQRLTAAALPLPDFAELSTGAREARRVSRQSLAVLNSLNHIEVVLHAAGQVTYFAANQRETADR